MKKIILVAFVCLSLFLFACSSKPGDASMYSLEQRQTLAQCMTDAGAVMYGTERCQFCANQKARFGEAFEFINFVDCDQNRIQCQAAGVKGFPTWVLAGNSFAGDMPLEQLAEIYGCEM